MTRIALLLALTVCSASAAVTLEVRVVVPCGARAGKPMKDPNGAGMICLDKKPFLTEKDVEGAEIHRTEAGNFSVFLTFHPDAAQRELQVTLKSIGKRVGIVLDGTLISAPHISSGSRFLFIDGKYDRARAVAIADEFNRIARAK